MIPFALQTTGYKGIQKGIKTFLKNLPVAKPTTYSGPGSSLELCQAISLMGFKQLLIVSDKTLIELGLLDKILGKLEELGVEVSVYDGILPDPTYDQINAGFEMLQKEGCEAVLAVGGGSVIDAAKVMCACATNNKPIDKMAGMFRVFKQILPLFVIPTTSGTGSEATVAAVVTDTESQTKKSIIDPKLIPLAAALDGSMMTGLPAGITAATGMDALTHAVEAYISSNALPDTDIHALVATRLIMENLERTAEKGSDIEARQNMAWASYYAGLAFTRAGVGYVHAIAHNFGSLYHTPHGLANAIVLPYILDYSKQDAIERLATLAKVSGLESAEGGESNDELADKFIARIRELRTTLKIPDQLEALQEKDVPLIARRALKEAHLTYAVPRYMDQKVCESIVRKMLA